MVIKIDSLSQVPIYLQLRNQIVLGIASKELTTGEALPSARRLAADLGINLHTVNKSYALLIDEGYIAIDRRRGTIVAEQASRAREIGSKLSETLLLASAEAINHQIDEKGFIDLCAKSYKKASEKPKS